MTVTTLSFVESHPLLRRLDSKLPFYHHLLKSGCDSTKLRIEIIMNTHTYIYISADIYRFVQYSVIA